MKSFFTYTYSHRHVPTNKMIIRGSLKSVRSLLSGSFNLPICLQCIAFYALNSLQLSELPNIFHESLASLKHSLCTAVVNSWSDNLLICEELVKQYYRAELEPLWDFSHMWEKCYRLDIFTHTSITVCEVWKHYYYYVLWQSQNLVH